MEKQCLSKVSSSFHLRLGRVHLVAVVVGILINLSDVNVGSALNLSEDNGSKGQHVLVSELVALEVITVVGAKAVILSIITEEVFNRMFASAFKDNIGILL